MVAEVQTLRPVPATESVVTALRQASVATGSDFDYLLSTAMRERSLEPQTKSESSSATGLFQFVDQTWLGLVKRFGEMHGLGRMAGAIEQAPSGSCTVNSAELKAEILALRHDPKVSALMAGEAAKETKASLECSLGRELSDNELYAAHFLGRGSARKLFGLHVQNPGQRADIAFPEAAKANRAVFYHRDGNAETVGEVCNWIVKKPSTSAPVQAAETLVVASPSPIAPMAANTGDVTVQRRVTISAQSDRLAAFATYQAPAVSMATLPRAGLVLNAALIEIFSALGPADFGRERKDA